MESLISICYSPCFSPPNSLNNYVLRYMVCNEFLMLMHFLCRYDPCIDDILRDWIVQKMSVKKRVLQKEIKQKALELILPYCPNFQASQRWISSFLHRHGINLTGNVSLKNTLSFASTILPLLRRTQHFLSFHLSSLIFNFSHKKVLALLTPNFKMY